MAIAAQSLRDADFGFAQACGAFGSAAGAVIRFAPSPRRWVGQRASARARRRRWLVKDSERDAGTPADLRMVAFVRDLLSRGEHIMICS
ncbi:hypothetical protein [uncultured Methylobacterium sp.]|uniref:hypothetical protein n=1 Tax=uncultured Methylobacterium sp. TaxID=157278 RepID=UPI002608FDDF|nr:hypothetical protein [uncultured Methylobacterium sp.]